MSFWTCIFGLVLLCLAYDLLVKAMRRREDDRDAGDTETLQEIHKLLTRLEDRVEALETIVIDRSKEADFYRKLSS